MGIRSISLIFFIIVSVGLCQAQHGHAHYSDPMGTFNLHWQLPQINRIISAGWGFSFGIEAYPRKGNPVPFYFKGRRGFIGSYFSFDVADSFAFDIDEPVTLKFLLGSSGGRNFTIAYDNCITAMATIAVEAAPRADGLLEATVVLERAHFVNGGHAGTDFSIIAKGADPYNLKLDKSHKIALLDIEIHRKSQVKNRTKNGVLALTTFLKNSNEKTPVRIGIYDSAGRMPVPSNKALHLHYMEREVKQLFLRTNGPRLEYWPFNNRHFFYIDGDYCAELPVGKYSVVVSKGPEYIIEKRTIEIKTADTLSESIALSRWINMPKAGWYSGDAHIHITRGI